MEHVKCVRTIFIINSNKKKKIKKQNFTQFYSTFGLVSIKM